MSTPETQNAAEATPAADAPEVVETYPVETEEEFEAVHARRRRRRGGEARMAGENISHLNLTPMMEIMTALLVFLVMSFANDPGNINVSLENLHPPESTATREMRPATSVTITADRVLVNDDEVLRLADYKHTPGKQMLIPEVRNALDREKEALQKLAEMGGSPFEGRLLVVAHETTPYALIADVLWSAGQAQFSKYELVVMKAGQKEGTTGH